MKGETFAKASQLWRIGMGGLGLRSRWPKLSGSGLISAQGR